MGTPFMEIYDSMLTVIQDYKIDNKYMENKEIVFQFLAGFIKNGIPDFDCLTSLNYETVEENVGTDIDPVMVERYYFINTLTQKEIAIISKIALSLYHKRKIQDVRAENASMSKREFAKGNVDGIQKEKRNWYNVLLNEIDSDIIDYQMQNLHRLPYWSDLS